MVSGDQRQSSPTLFGLRLSKALAATFVNLRISGRTVVAPMVVGLLLSVIVLPGPLIDRSPLAAPPLRCELVVLLDSGTWISARLI